MGQGYHEAPEHEPCWACRASGGEIRLIRTDSLEDRPWDLVLGHEPGRGLWLYTDCRVCSGKGTFTAVELRRPSRRRAEFQRSVRGRVYRYGYAMNAEAVLERDTLVAFCASGELAQGSDCEPMLI